MKPRLSSGSDISIATLPTTGTSVASSASSRKDTNIDVKGSGRRRNSRKPSRIHCTPSIGAACRIVSAM